MLNEFSVSHAEKERNYLYKDIEDQDERVERLRKQLVEKMLSEEGLAIDFNHISSRDISNTLVFRISGRFLIVEDDIGKFAGITFSDSKEEGMLSITDKAYLEGQDIYSGKGVMQMAFSLLCEYARLKGYKGIVGYVVRDLGGEKRLNMAAVFSRRNAIDLTSSDSSTYDARTQLDEESRKLVTHL